MPHSGEPPPTTLKVAMNELGGFRTDLGVALVAFLRVRLGGRGGDLPLE